MFSEIILFSFSCRFFHLYVTPPTEQILRGLTGTRLRQGDSLKHTSEEGFWGRSSTRESGVALSKPRGVSSTAGTTARGCGAPRKPPPRDPGGPSLHAATGIYAPGASRDPQRRSVKTRSPLRAWQGPPLRRPGFWGSRPSAPLPDLCGIRFRFLPFQLSASRSFPLLPWRPRGWSPCALTCARTTGGRRLSLPQWPPAASVLEASAEARRRRGGAGRRWPGTAPSAGSRLSTSSPFPSQVSLTSPLPEVEGGGVCEDWGPHPNSARGLPGAVERCPMPASLISIKDENLLISGLLSSFPPTLSGGEVGEGRDWDSVGAHRWALRPDFP